MLLRGDEELSRTVSGSDGKFVFDSLASGFYSNRVTGLADDDFSSGVSVQLAEGEARTGINLNVFPGATIQASSDSTTGGRLSGMGVLLWDNGKPATAFTDQSGFYRFEGLGLGTYHVQLELPGPDASRTISVTSIDATTYPANLNFHGTAHRRPTVAFRWFSGQRWGGGAV